MKLLNVHSKVLIITLILFVTLNNGIAEFIGDTIHVFAGIPNNALFIFHDGDAVVVDPGIEFREEDTLITNLDMSIDVGPSTIALTSRRPGEFASLLTPTGIEFIFTDLDWAGTPGIITDVALLPGNTLPVNDITFEDDSISILTSVDFTHETNVLNHASFDIVTAVPEPQSKVLALFVVVGVALLSRLTRLSRSWET